MRDRRPTDVSSSRVSDSPSKSCVGRPISQRPSTLGVVWARLSKVRRCLLLLIFLGTAGAFGAPALWAGPAAVPTDSTAASFSVRFGDTVIERPIMAVFVMPSSSTRLSVKPAGATTPIEVDAREGTIEAVGPHQWRFSAPETPGLYPVTLTDPTTDRSIRVQAFVLTPWNHRGRKLDGYRMGRYRSAALRGQERYERPEGFIEVTAQNKDVRVSPHFRLEQFLCKQTPTTPQFALVRTRLLQTLERVLAEVNVRGHTVPTLHVMSGFRTPYYNRAIGNTTDYSRHLYGDAADIFVDADGDGWMDDLTGDGQATEADARYLAAIVRQTEAGPRGMFEGGLGTYGPASHRGPFVHVDLRGYRARW